MSTLVSKIEDSVRFLFSLLDSNSQVDYLFLNDYLAGQSDVNATQLGFLISELVVRYFLMQCHSFSVL